MIALAIILGILLLICFIPVGVWVIFDDGDLTVKIPIWLFSLKIVPGKPKEKKPKKPKKAEKSPKKPRNPPKIVKNFDEIYRIYVALCGFIQRFGRKLHANKLYVRVHSGGLDPAKAAIDHGKICMALGILDPVLDNLFHIKKKEITADLDFSREKTQIYGEIDLRIAIGSLFLLLGYLLSRGIHFIIKRKAEFK